MSAAATVRIPKPTGSLRPVGASDLPDSLKYSKWDHIEVSDDEGDSHPNIDQKLMARLKKEKRMREYEEFRYFKFSFLFVQTPDSL